MTPERATTYTEIATPVTPREALRRIAGLPGRVLLESADGEGVSILAVDPLEVLRTAGGVTEVMGSAGRGTLRYEDPFAALDARLSLIRSDGGGRPPEPVPFRGGLIGFLSYEAGDTLEVLPPPPSDDVGMPEAWFGLYDHAIVWDHASGRIFGVSAPMPGGSAEETDDRLTRLLQATGRDVAETPGAAVHTVNEVTSSLDRASYMEGVARIRELIREGEFFQANLTRRVSVRTDIRGDTLYERLVEAGAGGYSAFIDTGTGAVASISPELLLSVDDGRVVTRPIKGTAPRGATPEEDERSARGLTDSAKDRAENVMIVDLLRNDLSRVCVSGSVEVSSLNRLETYPTVHHLVSTIEGQLAPGVGPVDVLRATYPGGSVTGAPKIRAMEVLRELEPVRRGVYTGAIGVMGSDGRMNLSVAIRTAVVRGGYAHYGTGGGITLSSDPEGEWNESELKAAPFLEALGLP